MAEAIIKGNYLDPAGLPVRATQMPDDDENIIGGHIQGIAWCGRWIRAASDSEPFLHYDDGGGPRYEPVGLTWDHGTTRHVAGPGDWIVWTGDEYRIVTAADFKRDYAAVDFTVSPEGGDA